MKRQQLEAADAQFFVVWGMCAVLVSQRHLRGAVLARAQAACWRELFVLLGMCGCGW